MEHLKDHSQEYCELCDMELVVEDHILLVHSQRLAGASEVLAGCISAAKANSGKAFFKKNQLLQVPMHGESPQVAHELVKLLCSKNLSHHLDQLLNQGKQAIHQVLEAADKYAMEELLNHIDYFLASHAKPCSCGQQPTWPPDSETVSWAGLTGIIALPLLAGELEKQLILNHAKVGCQASQLPIDMNVRIMEAVLARTKQDLSAHRYVNVSSATYALTGIDSCHNSMSGLKTAMQREGKLPPFVRK